jgi:hypothetical protein
MIKFDGPEDERVWATARILDREWAWMGVTLVIFILGSDEDGLSLRRYVEECWQGDMQSAFRVIEAVEFAAETVGLELPWDRKLIDGDVRFVVRDRPLAVQLASALDSVPTIESELRMLTL